MTARERRRAILKLLCERKFETRANLAFEFNVSTRSIEYDIQTLSLHYPIYTVSGRGGGIYIDKNFKLNSKYLNDKQTELLNRIMPILSGEDEETMKSILNSFINPQKKRDKK